VKLLAAAAVMMAALVSAQARENVSVAPLPDAMVGDWCSVAGDSDASTYSRGRCSFAQSDGKLTVRPRGYEFIESGCDVVTARRIKRRVYLVHGDCGGEGMTWTEDVMFQLENGRLSLVTVSHSKEKAEEAAAPDPAPASPSLPFSWSLGSEPPTSPTIQDAPVWLKKR
jgi:hypothetical protein